MVISLTSKKKSIWPLPGGNYKYVDTLTKCLKFISQGGKKLDEIEDWFIKNFDNVKKRGGIRGYLYVLIYYIPFIKNKNDVFVLTEQGKEFLKTNNIETIYETLNSNVNGFEQIIEFIKLRRRTKKEIHDMLVEKLKAEWKGYHQTNYRLGWLLSLGKIKQKSNHYQIP